MLPRVMSLCTRTLLVERDIAQTHQTKSFQFSYSLAHRIDEITFSSSPSSASHLTSTPATPSHQRRLGSAFHPVSTATPVGYWRSRSDTVFETRTCARRLGSSLLHLCEGLILEREKIDAQTHSPGALSAESDSAQSFRGQTHAA